MGCAGWGGCAGSAGVGNITRTGASRAAGEGALPVGSCSIEEAIIRPPPKPTARTTNVVPTPAKKMRAFDDMVVYSQIPTNARISGHVPARVMNAYKAFVYLSDRAPTGAIACRS